MSYADFLKRKQRVVAPAGKRVIDAEIHGTLHEWQRDIVAWACDRGNLRQIEADIDRPTLMDGAV